MPHSKYPAVRPRAARHRTTVDASREKTEITIPIRDAAACHVERTIACVAHIQNRTSSERSARHRNGSNTTGAGANVAGRVGDAAACHVEGARAVAADVEIPPIVP